MKSIAQVMTVARQMRAFIVDLKMKLDGKMPNEVDSIIEATSIGYINDSIDKMIEMAKQVEYFGANDIQLFEIEQYVESNIYSEYPLIGLMSDMVIKGIGEVISILMEKLPEEH